MFDVVVVGAGVAGSSAAYRLSKAGYRVALVENSTRIPPAMRAEKLGTEAVDLFERFGLADAFYATATPIYSIWVARFGRLMARMFKKEFGFSYDMLVEQLRASLPSSVDLRFGRISAIERSSDIQCLELSDGSTLTARLIVVATGHGNVLKKMLGISTKIVSPGHSMCIGFYLDKPRRDFPFESLVYYGERRSDRIAYLSLFPIGTRMRANLFVYEDHKGSWANSFREAPTQTLHETLPRLEKLIGNAGVGSDPTIRQIDLTQATEFEGDGVVLIGDAFCTSCPITGTGLRKALIDVEQLVTWHVPGWLATPGMSREKIAEFYSDPVKASFDAESRRSSMLLRGIKVGTWREWGAKRLKRGLRTKVSFQAHRVADKVAAAVSMVLAII
jgi:2-polyprenyl-6-methoxyphenol hydroxylase-like FAD-dependent oxidoreductase